MRTNRPPCIYNRDGFAQNKCKYRVHCLANPGGKKISVLIEISVWTRNDATMVRHVSRILTARDNENGGTPLRADKMYIAMMQRKQR